MQIPAKTNIHPWKPSNSITAGKYFASENRNKSQSMITLFTYAIKFSCLTDKRQNPVKCHAQ